MIDPFVILAPVLLLAVIALLRFVGCDQVLGLGPIEPPPKITIIPGSINADMLTMPFELTINAVDGSGFDVSVALVYFGASQKTPKPGSTTTQLLVDITPDDVLAIGPVSVYVISHGNSNLVTFTVNPGTPTDVLFDNPTPPGNSGDPLNSPPPYKNLDFGSGQWRWEFRPGGSVISFNTPGAASFSFANGKRILDNLIVYPTTAGTIKLSDGINPDVLLTFIALQINSFQTVSTDWKQFSNTVTVEFDAAPTLPVYRITYFGPP